MFYSVFQMEPPGAFDYWIEWAIQANRVDEKECENDFWSDFFVYDYPAEETPIYIFDLNKQSKIFKQAGSFQPQKYVFCTYFIIQSKIM